MDWFRKPKYMTVRVPKKDKKAAIPENLVTRCPACNEIIFNKEIESADRTCPKCNHHFHMPALERLRLLADNGIFLEQLSGRIKATDPLGFPGYQEKLEKGKKNTSLEDAVIGGICTVGGIRTGLAITDFGFMGGSMGSVLGEEVARLIERCCQEKIPVIIVSSSGGGARMQEGIISLMQMAKTSAALARLAEAGLLFVSVLADPTGGGVTASFAMLGDIIIAEPNALIMFAGPRVIEQTIRQHLPKRFQRAEFLQEHGMIDMIVKRQDLKKTLARLLTVPRS
ncbi:acetyl-CoA carboxylase carboxyltransferase subunit beta [candidate division FCPU426 bacterium]|nr:acetyl-CoA carboxylase carboxyltransferase subunit beta [candidate division FCPU426 bacterium]